LEEEATRAVADSEAAVGRGSSRSERARDQSDLEGIAPGVQQAERACGVDRCQEANGKTDAAVCGTDDVAAGRRFRVRDRVGRANLRREIDIEDENAAADRTGIFTTGIVSTREGCKIALFFTGRQHAGENLRDILAERAAVMKAPIQMCDALSRNLPKLPEKLEVIVSHCLAHARRRFVEVTPNFPEACRHVLEALAEVYNHDALAQERSLSPEERLLFHQQRSGPVMDELHTWLRAQLEEKKVEPNSGLGGAITYLLKYWERLTLFLRHAGAPVDNNVCERALKRAILHRKNSLFYKTENGAHVGDVFMSLIHSAELCGANPFDYLTELQRHADELKENPSQWMPWNYRSTLQRAEAAINSG